MNIKKDIFLLSFLILFLELALIRFLPAQVAYLGYYSNFILLGSFVGIGLGMMFAKDKRDFIWGVPTTLLVLCILISIFQVTVLPDSSGEIHFISSVTSFLIPEVIFIPFLFVSVMLLFIMLSQHLGKLLNSLPSLTVYTWDILGSLTGIVVFAIASYFHTNPLIWFTIFSITFLYLIKENSNRWRISCLLFLLLGISMFAIVKDTSWSPYQKISVEADRTITNKYFLLVNNIGHQVFSERPYEMWPIYTTPYTTFTESPASIKKILIIGSGSGNDVATALKYTHATIDAVEIDPLIYKTGKDMHPERPYQSDRVHIHINDARSFLEKSNDSYDLIIFALPDSLMLASTHGNIRLESFLFTKESFISAKNHLNENGTIVLYNYYRQPWLVAKLAGMLDEVFGTSTYVIQETDDPNSLTALINGNNLKDREIKSEITFTETLPRTYIPATDNWPFLYLSKPSIPLFYLILLVSTGLFVYLFLSRGMKKPLLTQIQPTYFFLGVGFLLLETKSIIQFSLLFGATWVTNALVFFAILVSILIAIHVAARVKKVSIRFLYILLGASLLLQYFLPLDILLGYATEVKYLIISILTFAPIFIANTIFSLTFKESKENARNFSSNLLGAALGGILEYLALLLGYQNITIIIILCYFLAFLPARKVLTK